MEFKDFFSILLNKLIYFFSYYLVLKILHILTFRYTDGEIHFNLMAIVSDKKMLYERRLEELTCGMLTDEVQTEINRLRFLIECENEKNTLYEREMARRRHNYLPFIVELLKILSDRNMLMPLYEKAKQRATEKSAKRQKT